MWEAPEHDGGSPVTHYQIEKREVSRKTWVKVHVKFCWRLHQTTCQLCSACVKYGLLFPVMLLANLLG